MWSSCSLSCARRATVTGEDQGDGNDIGSIDTGGGKKTEDAGGSSGTSVERVEVSTLATNLEVPWSFAFLPGGNALVTERDSGRLLTVNPSGEARVVQTLPEGGSGEGGLLGVAVSPNYEEDRYVYAYYTTERDNRVVRFRHRRGARASIDGHPGQLVSRRG